MYALVRWKPVQAVPQPSASVTISSHAVLPVIKRGAAYTPVRMWQVAGSPGSWVFDMGQNMAGYAVLYVVRQRHAPLPSGRRGLHRRAI